MSVRTSKASYRQHEYSGSRKSLKRVRSGIRRYYAEGSRVKIWRSEETKKKPVNEEIVIDNSIMIKETMEERKVDPKLFVTCRLCLEDLGQYQIVPSVQQQIKYCFDIEVEPFDGLPQLICMNCKEILVKFHKIKTTFCEKQTNLRSKEMKNKENVCIQPQQDLVSSSQQAPDTIEPNQLTNHINDEPHSPKMKNMKRRRLLLSSSSEVELEETLQPSKLKKKRTLRPRGPMPWKAKYKQFFSCTLCHSVWPNKKSFDVHSHSHDVLKVKFKDIFNRQCAVNLVRIDDKPNVTGLSKVVVYSSNKIIERGNSFFNTIYSKEDVASPNHFNSDLIKKQDENLTQESSDDNDEILFKPTQRKRRLISRSSNETVVIESNTHKMASDAEDIIIAKNCIEGPLNNDQCINIDDSSDSESDQIQLTDSGKVKQPIQATIGDYKIIQGIISMCVNSYHKKKESKEVHMVYMNVNEDKKNDNVKIYDESQLKHKILSIGRKVITKQGFNCTGLLRYMEYKSLKILWVTKPPLHPKDSNYIRILTRLRNARDSDDDTGWVNVPKVSQPKLLSLLPLTNSTKIAAPTKSSSSITVSNDSAAAKIETSQSEKSSNQAQLDEMPAMLYLDTSKGSTSDSKKLLNASPVANPKQLPKKLGPGNESRPSKTSAQQSICLTTNADVNLCMPIITSTTSLATIPSKEQTQDTNQKSCVTSVEIEKTETPAPRIKVKPASELMSQKTLNSMKEQTTTATNMFVSQIENVWPHQHPANVFIPTIALPTLVTSPPHISVLQTQQVNAETAYQEVPGPITTNTKDPDYIILDSTDFPNTKTDSPFRYVKDLLQMHNIFLLDTHETIPEKFNNLIRFKVVFKQDNLTVTPVVLCLSLLCFKNTFCFLIKDKNQGTIDLTTLSANWQWEILQMYRGNVSNKVLQNARRLGQETYDFTNNFFCLLKAINCRKPC